MVELDARGTLAFEVKIIVNPRRKGLDLASARAGKVRSEHETHAHLHETHDNYAHVSHEEKNRD
jgi:hypothetical protein